MAISFSRGGEHHSWLLVPTLNAPPSARPLRSGNSANAKVWFFYCTHYKLCSFDVEPLVTPGGWVLIGTILLFIAASFMILIISCQCPEVYGNLPSEKIYSNDYGGFYRSVSVESYSFDPDAIEGCCEYSNPSRYCARGADIIIKNSNSQENPYKWNLERPYVPNGYY